MSVLNKQNTEKASFVNVLQHLSPRQREIVEWVYKLHVATRVQLQEIANHKGHSRITIWLKDLTAKGFLHKDILFETPGKKKPNVYSLGAIGVKMAIEYFGNASLYLKQKLKNPWYDRRFMTHDLMVGDFYLAFLRLARSKGDKLELLGNNENITQETEVSLTDDFDIQSTILSEPDAVLSYLKQGSQSPAIYYVEVDRYNMSGPKFLLKINRYLRFFESGKWRDHYPFFPMILIITVNEMFLETIYTGIEEILTKYKEPEDMFRLTTFEAIKKQGINAPIWRMPLAQVRQYTTKLVD